MGRWGDGAMGRVGEWGSWRVGEWASGRVGEWASGRVGEWASGRVGEWASGRVGEWASGRGVSVKFDPRNQHTRVCFDILVALSKITIDQPLKSSWLVARTQLRRLVCLIYKERQVKRPTGANCGVHVGEVSRVETTQYYQDRMGQTKPLKF